MNVENICKMGINIEAVDTKKLIAALIAGEITAEAASRINGEVTANTYNHPATILSEIFNKTHENILARL